MKRLLTGLWLLLLMLCGTAHAQEVYIPENIKVGNSERIYFMETADAYYYSFGYVPSGEFFFADRYCICRQDKQSGEVTTLVDTDEEICELFLSKDALYYRTIPNRMSNSSKVMRVSTEDLQESIFFETDAKTRSFCGASGDWVYYIEHDFTHTHMTDETGKEILLTGADILCRKNAVTGEIREISRWTAPPAQHAVMPPERTCIYYQTIGARYWTRYGFERETAEEIALGAKCEILSADEERLLVRKDGVLWLWGVQSGEFAKLECVDAWENRYALGGNNVFYLQTLTAQSGSTVYISGHRLMRYDISTKTVYEMTEFASVDCMYVMKDRLICSVSNADGLALQLQEEGISVPPLFVWGTDARMPPAKIRLFSTPFEVVRWKVFIEE